MLEIMKEKERFLKYGLKKKRLSKGVIAWFCTDISSIWMVFVSRFVSTKKIYALTDNFGYRDKIFIKI